MAKIIVLIGAPGAGKGTQARMLDERRGIPQISTGDMFREMQTLDTPFAREVQEIMRSGKLVPDDVTYRVVKERTDREPADASYVLDGYPRTAVQAEQLEELAGSQGKEISAVEIDVPRELILQRLTGRRKCPICDEIYNIYSMPPKIEGRCDKHPDAELEQRADDFEETVKTRLETYDTETRPLIDSYRESGRLEKVDGTGDVESIYCELEKLV